MSPPLSTRTSPTGRSSSGLILGLIGAVAAILVQKVAIGIAGFLAGGYFLMTALRTWEMQAPETSWISFLIGGVIGALLMYAVFNWALIILSSISGAHLIIHPFALSHAEATAAFVVLAIIGIMAQGKMLRRAAHRKFLIHAGGVRCRSCYRSYLSSIHFTIQYASNAIGMPITQEPRKVGHSTSSVFQ